MVRLDWPRSGRGDAGFSHGLRGCLQHPIERVAFEWIAEFQIDVEHGLALVAAELFEAGRMDAARHAGAQRAALEAVATQDLGVEAGDSGAGLENASDGPDVGGNLADSGQGRGVLPPMRSRGGGQTRRTLPLGDCGCILRCGRARRHSAAVSVSISSKYPPAKAGGFRMLAAQSGHPLRLSPTRPRSPLGRRRAIFCNPRSIHAPTRSKRGRGDGQHPNLDFCNL
jgi:hypothetical protein